MKADEMSVCRICYADDLEAKWRVHGFEWARCRACGSLVVTNVPSSNFFDEHYNDAYYQNADAKAQRGRYIDYVGHRPFIQANLQRRVEWAQHLMKQETNATWLDIGCAAGFLMDVVRTAGFSAYGLDYAGFGPAYARDVLSLPNARQGTLDAIPDDFPNRFDIISFMDVLEHVPDQHHTLSRAAELLVDGGYMIGETFIPDSLTAQVMGKRWHAIDPPNHLAVLSLDGIDRLLSQHGLQRVGLARMARRLSATSVLSKFGTIGQHLGVALNRTRLGSIGVPVQLNDAAVWLYQKGTGTR